MKNLIYGLFSVTVSKELEMDWGKKFQKRYIALGFLDLRVS